MERDQSVENLKYLSSRQALGDIAEFIIGMNKGYGLRDPVWITFGGSYAGSLSLWARQEYPELVAGAVGSSAPLEAKLDFWDDQEVAEARLRSENEGCASSFEKAYEEMSNMTKSLDGRIQLKKLLKLVYEYY
ncbi:hypothetical protein OESDEN_04014 [Oesophagostomum dentatum]|uniref:Serine carboxypeptidase S28 n=1 Tax=Oesophagostomum dentatum TaxID=61180 RepID=A0A0B1TFJ2_OESDE|nr:hypothetical protein OESDEN_04014 [Oesophagostomum dentatum]